MHVDYISNSQVDKFEMCPMMWYYHYVEKYRSIYKPSSLFFGSALDEAFGRLHLDKKKPENFTDEEKELFKKTPEEVFLDTLRYQDHNKVNTDLKYSAITSFFAKDFQLELLEPEDLEEISKYADEQGLAVEPEDVEAFYAEAKQLKKKGVLADGDLLVHNLIGWLSLKRKGLILIEGYRQEVMPQIEEVFEIQKKVELTNDNGTTYIGYIDYTAKLVGVDEPLVVCDDKTSSKKYASDAVQLSTQLASYCKFVGVTVGAYSVVEKEIRKREPRFRTQLLVGEIPEETFEKTFDRIEKMLDNIEDENFYRADELEGGDKNCYHFGRKCEFWNLCHGDGELHGLVDMKEKK